MMNSQRSDTEKLNLIDEGKEQALMRLLNAIIKLIEEGKKKQALMDLLNAMNLLITV